MEINKIGSPNAIQPSQNQRRVDSTSSSAVSNRDSVDFSEEGKTQALYKKAASTIENTADVRMSKIEEARELIDSFKTKPPSDEMLEVVARRILGDWADMS